MSDPLGLISGAGNTNQIGAQGSVRKPTGTQQGPDFKSMLMDNLTEVNALQADASKATEDLMSGKRQDLEGVIAATDKADTAFKMLQAMRNKMMEAYDEVKQMRV